MLITLLAFLFFLQVSYLFLDNKKLDVEVLNRFLSLFIFIFLMSLFLIKNEYFGADTKNYLSEFNVYCLDPEAYVGLDYTYKVIFTLINFLMFGACDTNWIIWVWPYFVIGIVFVALLSFKVDKLFAIALFSSFIGIELLTNAMRQGFSIAILFLSFSFYLRNRFIQFGIFAAISLLFHLASALIILIFVISRLNYRLFIPSLILGLFFVFGTTLLDIFPGVMSFKSSIYKYMPYAFDDFIVRLISIINIIVTFVIYLLFTKKFVSQDIHTKNWLFNILFVCAIVSVVPYFGFRVVYGIYPLFLLATYFSVRKHSHISYKYLSIITCSNIIITIIWLCGSAQMRAIPFVSLI